LLRNKVSDHRYEDVEPWHSWNSDFIFGRLVLFELTRHSDHHWEPAKHYQLLDSMPQALQLPAGYPAMMLLSLFPPAWFAVMDKRLTGG
ncbi:MAG: alkane 1-monooxygenase, partial [Phycisphaerae bacterium]